MSLLFGAVFLISGLLVGLSRSQQPVSSCQDIDTGGCQTFFQAKPDLCSDPAFSQKMCKRFCGNCPLECYSCPHPVTNVQDCNTTTTCGGNMTCMTKHYHALDGHHEYILTCESKELCTGLNFGFGKREEDRAELPGFGARLGREVSLDCCYTDLCNYPLPPAITATTTTTAAVVWSITTQHTAGTVQKVPPSTCNRDIVFVLDASGSVGHSNFEHMLDFVRQFVSRLNIGPSQAQVSVVEFSTKPQVVWDLNTYATESALTSALSRVPYTSGSTHTAEALSLVTHSVLTPTRGDRPHADNVVVVVTDGQSNNALATSAAAATLHHVAKHVVAVGVGAGVSQAELRSIATDSSHVIDVLTFPNLRDILSKLTGIVCS